MKTKTITKESIEDFDKAVNDFETQHKTKFTQTHVTSHAGRLLYSAVLFYQEE